MPETSASLSLCIHLGNLNLVNLFDTKFCCLLKDKLFSGSAQCVSSDNSRLHQEVSTSGFHKLTCIVNVQKV